MKSTLITLFGLFLIAGCASDPNGISLKSIQDLEEKVKSTSDIEAAKQLLEAYDKYISDFPDDQQNNATFLFRSAELAYILNDFPKSIQSLKYLLSVFPETAYDETATNLLGNIYREKLQSEDLAQIVFQSLLAKFPNNQDARSKVEMESASLEERIQALEKRIFDENTGKIDFNNASQYIDACDLFALLNAKNPLAPQFLYRSSETYRAVRNFKSAIALYDRILNQYPDFNKNEQILFLKAFTLDNDLKDFNEAKIAYEEYLNRFPNSDFSDDAKFLLDNLGKDEEEVIKKLIN
jgi:tetratricopeptide (TPR) repeat protein